MVKGHSFHGTERLETVGKREQQHNWKELSCVLQSWNADDVGENGKFPA